MSIERARSANQDIFKYGDVTDFRRNNFPFLRIMLPMLAPAAGLNVGFALSQTERPSAVVGGAVTVSTLAMGVLYARHKYSREAAQRNHFKNLNETARSINPDLTVDVVACENSNKILYHKIPLTVAKESEEGNSTLREETEAEVVASFDAITMRRVANHTQDLGLDAVVFEVTDDIRLKIDPERVQSLNAWFSENKANEIDMSELVNDNDWIELTAVELHQLANEVERESITLEIERYVDMLRVRSRSKIPEQYERYIAGELTYELFLKLVDHEYCTVGQDTVMYRELDRLSGENKFVKEGTFLSRKGDIVTEVATAYDGSTTRLQSRTLLATVGVQNESDLKEQLDDLAIEISDDTEQKLRVAIILALQNTSIQQETNIDDGSESIFDRVTRRNIDRFIDKKRHNRRFIGAIACFSFGLGASFAAPLLLNDKVKDDKASLTRIYQAQSPQYKSSHSFKEFLSTSKSAKAASVLAYETKNEILDGIAGAIDPNRIGLGDIQGKHQAYSSEIGGSIGDVEEGDLDQEIYSVTSINGASTGGYWGQYTADYMSFPLQNYDQNPQWRKSSLEVSNSTNEQEVHSGNISPSAPKVLPISNEVLIQNHAPHIEVYRKDVSFALAGGDIPLVVRQNTSLAAAVYEIHYNDETIRVPASYYQNVDNEWFITPPVSDRIPKNGNYYTIGLRYWLEEDAEAEPLRANFPLTFSDGKWVGPLNAFDTSKTAKKLGSNPLSAIQSKTYSFTPLGDEGVSPDAGNYSSLDEYGQQLASLKSANCNVAATEYMLATRGVDREGYTLNPVVGFYNNGDGSLKRGEAHMWVTNTQGEITDPTPSNPLESKELESVINWQDVIKYGSGAGLIGAVALLGYRRRKSFANAAIAVKNVAARKSHDIIVKNPQPIDGHLIGKIQHTLYSHPDSNTSPREIDTSDVDKALDLMPSLSYRQASEMVGKLSPMNKLRLGAVTLAIEHRTKLRTQDV